METAYEAVYIIDTGLPEEQVNAIVEKYTGVVTRGGGVVDDIDRWEPRRLAYEVKGKREGAHICMNFRSEPAARDELDRIFRISDDVLRFLVIKQDERADRFPSKARAAEQERRDREMAARAAAAAATAAASAAVGPAAVAAAGARQNGGEPARSCWPPRRRSPPTPADLTPRGRGARGHGRGARGHRSWTPRRNR
jgi:small subunit ribosomal protein S6